MGIEASHLSPYAWEPIKGTDCEGQADWGAGTEYVRRNGQIIAALPMRRFDSVAELRAARAAGRAF